MAEVCYVTLSQVLFLFVICEFAHLSSMVFIYHCNWLQEGYRVALNVYDLSQGLARQLSVSFLGKAIEGIW